MLKTFLKLTGSKSAPATEEQLAKYRTESKTRDVWKSDVVLLRAIVSDLRVAYESHKGDFAVSRYEELKAMIKSAIERTNKSLTGTGRGLAGVSNGAGSGAGTSTSLKRNAEQLAKISEKSKDIGLTEDDVTTGQLSEATEYVRRELIDLKHEYRTLRDSLNALSKEYEQSKNLNPAQRYAALKDMIKTILAKTEKSTS